MWLRSGSEYEIGLITAVIQYDKEFVSLFTVMELEVFKEKNRSSFHFKVRHVSLISSILILISSIESCLLLLLSNDNR